MVLEPTVHTPAAVWRPGLGLTTAAVRADDTQRGTLDHFGGRAQIFDRAVGGGLSTSRGSFMTGGTVNFLLCREPVRILLTN